MALSDKNKHHLIVASILTFGAALRLAHLDHFSMWIDEIASIRESDSITEAIFLHGNGTAYFVALNIWRDVFGQSAYAVRSLNALIDTIMAVSIYCCTTLITKDRRVGCLTMLVFVCAPMAVWHGRNARMYPLWSLMSMVGLWSVFLLHKHGVKWRTSIVYTLSLGLGVLAHNYMLFYAIAFATAAWFAVGGSHWRKTGRDIAYFLLLHSGLLIIASLIITKFILKIDLVSLLPYMKKYSYTGVWWDSPYVFYHGFIFDTWMWREHNPTTTTLAWIGAFFMVCGFVWLRLKTDFDRSKIIILAVSIILPIAFVSILPIRKSLRYVYPSVPMLIVFWGVVGSEIWKRKRGNLIIGAASAMTMIAFAPSLYRVYAHEPEPWRKACAEVMRINPHADRVYVETPMEQSGLSQCENFPAKVVVAGHVGQFDTNTNEFIVVSRTRGLATESAYIHRLSQVMTLRSSITFSRKIVVADIERKSAAIGN